jgi:hypothetical protein
MIRASDGILADHIALPSLQDDRLFWTIGRLAVLILAALIGSLSDCLSSAPKPEVGSHDSIDGPSKSDENTVLTMWPSSTRTSHHGASLHDLCGLHKFT